MKISQIVLYDISIPFKYPVQTFQIKQKEARNIVLEITWENGIKSYGEGVPKKYLTNESTSTIVKDIKKFSSKIFQSNINNIADIQKLLKELRTLPSKVEENRKRNAAICSLDIALIDALSQKMRIKAKNLLSALLNNSPYQKPILYAVVLPLVSDEMLETYIYYLKQFKFEQLKVKLGLSNEADINRIEKVRAVWGKNVDLRVDINSGWDGENLLRMAKKMEKYNISYIEDPLPVKDITELEYLRKEISQKIIVDDFASCRSNVEKIIDRKLCSLVNIKISKCGGLLSSLDIYSLLKKNKVDALMGCQIGESGILEAAGRIFATATGDLKYCEGSVSDYYLQENILPGISVGEDCLGGHISKMGLGGTVNKEVLKKYTVHTEKICA